MRRSREKRGRQLPSRLVNGRSPSSRQRASRSWPASCPEVLCGLLKPRRPPKWTGASFCGGRGPRPSPPTTAGCAPTGAMSGPGSICRESHRKAWGKLPIAVDCSGSVSARQLGLFEAEIRSILAGQRPRLVHVLYFDAAVQKVETYQAGEPISLTPVGGGGTDFRPCFDWLHEQGIVPQTLVFLTDLCGTFPSEAPPYPVIWASTENRRAPFGQVVSMEAA